MTSSWTRSMTCIDCKGYIHWPENSDLLRIIFLFNFVTCAGKECLGEHQQVEHWNDNAKQAVQVWWILYKWTEVLMASTGQHDGGLPRSEVDPDRSTSRKQATHRAATVTVLTGWRWAQPQFSMPWNKCFAGATWTSFWLHYFELWMFCVSPCSSVITWCIVTS